MPLTSTTITPFAIIMISYNYDRLHHWKTRILDGGSTHTVTNNGWAF